MISASRLHPYFLFASLLIPGIVFLTFRVDASKWISEAATIRRDSIDPTVAMNRWVDSVYMQLSPQQRLAQLVMIRAHSDKGEEYENEIARLIREYQPGGVLFFQGNPIRQAELTNRYQASAEIPLMVAMDAEWGLGMRLDSAMSFPYALTLGAIQDDRLLFEMGKEIGRQCRRLGVHVNFAPVADINNNPENPVIGFRSFGEDRYSVTLKSFWYLQGMRESKVMGCAKHFPGHGDTNTDSHFELPIISHRRQRLDSLELFPFHYLIGQGLESIMIAHLSIPALDSTTGLPSTLSRNIVTGLLREKMGFDGLIFTDGMEMKGVTDHFPSGEAEARAVQAGNDIVLLPRDLGVALDAIEKFVDSGKISAVQLETSVKRVLATKYRLGLTTPQRVDTTRLLSDLSTPEAEGLRLRLFERAMTMVRNADTIVPLALESTSGVASLSIGAEELTPFQEMLGQYGVTDHYQVPIDASEKALQVMMRNLQEKSLLVVSLHAPSLFPRNNFGVPASVFEFLKQLEKNGKLILTVFGNPYLLSHLDSIGSVVMAYVDNQAIQQIAAQGLVGAIGFSGKLPVSVTPLARLFQGVKTKGGLRLGYAPPGQVGLDPEVCRRADTLMAEAIASGATPGGVILAVKNGRICFEKAYGHHTKSENRPTLITDIYDLASITKIAATTLAIMKLYDEGQIDLHVPIRQYLPELDTFNKGALTIFDIMTHRARLQPWIPFYANTLETSKKKNHEVPSSAYYRPKALKGFELPVTEKLFMRTDYADSIRYQIWSSELREKDEVKYSDLGFYLLADIVNRVSGQTLDAFVETQFYRPMGLQSTGYNPWKRFPIDCIAPTERDDYFRFQDIRGYVHDMGAAMMGGVSGHAGLFSSARDLAVLFEMLLRGGEYGGRRYLNPATIRLFTTRRSDGTRKAIGFDMREMNPENVMNMCPMASPTAFGHLGFTGTAAWADPTEDLIFILLTNRTHPTKSNALWGEMDYRPRLQEVFYQAIERPEYSSYENIGGVSPQNHGLSSRQVTILQQVAPHAFGFSTTGFKVEILNSIPYSRHQVANKFSVFWMEIKSFLCEDSIFIRIHILDSPLLCNAAQKALAFSKNFVKNHLPPINPTLRCSKRGFCHML